MTKWTKLPSVFRKGKHFFTANYGDTRYWITQRRSNYWQVEDNHGAAWGSFDTAKQAMAAVDRPSQVA